MRPDEQAQGEMQVATPPTSPTGDAQKRIEIMLGPQQGMLLDVATGEADTAISEGWARDPYATTEHKTLSDEDRERAIEAATKARDRWTGQERKEGDKSEAPAQRVKPQPKPQTGEHRDMHAGEAGDYATRDKRR